MSEDAVAAPSWRQNLRAIGGPFDLGESRWFRYLFFFLIYFGYSLPLGFFAYIYITWGVAEHDTSKFLAVLMFTVIQIPFFLRPIWSIPVDRGTGSRHGRRRPWVVGGTAVHLLMVGTLLFISPFEQPILWPIIVMLAMIPRVVAEQAIGGMMVELIPDPGRVSGTITLAFRIGGIVGNAVIITFVWGSRSWLRDAADVLNETAAMQVTFGVLALFLLVSMAMALLLVEGRVRRGPLAMVDGDPRVVADDDGMDAELLYEQERAVLDGVVGEEALAAAEEDATKPWPEGTPLSTRFRAAFSTRTAVLCLFAALLLPLGDGFESWGRFWLIEHHGWSGTRFADWAPYFTLVGFMGLIGPMMSDFVDRRRMLMGTALALVACYLLVAFLIAIEAGQYVFLVAWTGSLMLSDWLIFTFLALVVEIADARMGATHLGVYTSLQAISSTFLMVWLSAWVLANSSYAVLFALAALGPAAGFLLFRRMHIPHDESERGTDHWDVDEASASWRDRVRERLGGPLGLATLDSDRDERRRMRLGVMGLGLLIVLPLLLASPFWTMEVKETEERWTTAWNMTAREATDTVTLTEGQDHQFVVEVPEEGLIRLRWHWEATPQGGVGNTGPDLDATVTAPTSVTWDQGLGNQTAVTLPGPMSDAVAEIGAQPSEVNLSADSEDALEDEVEASRNGTDEDWAYGAGTWTLDVTVTDNGDPTGLQGTPVLIEFRVSIEAWEEPDDDLWVETSTTEFETKRIGVALASVLSPAVLLPAGWVAWLVGRRTGLA